MATLTFSVLRPAQTKPITNGQGTCARKQGCAQHDRAGGLVRGPNTAVPTRSLTAAWCAAGFQKKVALTRLEKGLWNEAHRVAVEAVGARRQQEGRHRVRVVHEVAGLGAPWLHRRTAAVAAHLEPTAV